MNGEDASAAERDGQLIAGIAAGDRRAFRTFFDVYGPRIFRYAVRTMGDAGKAEEVTNDVMLEVWKNASRFEQRSSVSTWVIGIARHKSLNAIRGKQLVTVDIADVAEQITDDGAAAESGEAELDQAEMRLMLRAAVAKLSPEHRDVVELTFFHGHSYEEIAEIVGCPENTVKTRMFHAKRQLKALLGERAARAFNIGAVA